MIFKFLNRKSMNMDSIPQYSREVYTIVGRKERDERVKEYNDCHKIIFIAGPKEEVCIFFEIFFSFFPISFILCIELSWDRKVADNGEKKDEERERDRSFGVKFGRLQRVCLEGSTVEFLSGLLCVVLSESSPFNLYTR